MSFVSYTSPRQVLFDNEGNPLVGRVFFLDSQTLEKKVIYEDASYTTTLENPVFTDSAGRLENQVFLGQGTYKVKHEKYIGSGNMKDPDIQEDPQYWELVIIETVEGLNIGTSGAATDVVFLNTIADVRAITEPSASPNLIVLNYYTDSDNVEPRKYHWNSSSVVLDNYGTVIKCTNVVTGRYEMEEEEIIDVRSFGIFPGVSYTNNSQLDALISWCNSSSSKTKTIYFPKGTYYFVATDFTFTNKVIIENGTKFAVSGAGTLRFYINGQYDILATDTLSNSSNVKVLFNGIGGFVNSRWLKGSNGYETLTNIRDNVSINYDIVVNETIVHTAPQVVVLDKDLIFESGNLILSGGSVTFDKINITNKTDSYILDDANNAFGFFNLIETKLKSSFFDSSKSLDKILLLDTGSTGELEIDDERVIEDNITQSGSVLLNITYGQVTINDGKVFTWDNFIVSDQGRFIGPGRILTHEEIQLDWFVKESDVEKLSGFNTGIVSAKENYTNLKVLDMNNHTIDLLNQNVSNTITSDLTIKNGSLNISASNPYYIGLQIIGTSGVDCTFNFENINIEQNIYGKLSIGDNIDIINVKNVKSTSIDTSAYNLFHITNSSIINLNLYNSSVEYSLFLSSNDELVYVNAYNSKIQIIDTGVINASNCELTSLNIRPLSTLKNNKINGLVNIIPNSTGSYLDGVVSNNTFYYPALIKLNGGISSCKVRNVNIKDNFFYGNWGSIPLIECSRTGFFDSTSGANHKIEIIGNTSNNTNNILRQTNNKIQGVLSMYTSDPKARIDMTNPSNNSQIFFLEDQNLNAIYGPVVTVGINYYDTLISSFFDFRGLAKYPISTGNYYEVIYTGTAPGSAFNTNIGLDYKIF